MELIARSYETLELVEVRSELEKRGIAVHISDEFTYAIPGMPGAEQPRGIWVAEEDVVPARRVVADLLGADRVHQPDVDRHADSNNGHSENSTNSYRGLLFILLGALCC